MDGLIPYTHELCVEKLEHAAALLQQFDGPVDQPSPADRHVAIQQHGRVDPAATTRELVRGAPIPAAGRVQLLREIRPLDHMLYSGRATEAEAVRALGGRLREVLS